MNPIRHNQPTANLMQNVTDFPGNPAAPIENYRARNYGLQPGTTPLLAEMADLLQSTIAKCRGHGAAAAAKSAMRGYVCEPQLLDTVHKESDSKNYRRHLLYAAPDASLSIIAVVWMPGQATPVHGHTAWGSVGVYEGDPFCETFYTWQNGHEAMSLFSKMTLRMHPGDLATTRPGIDDLHRIGNDTSRRCITVHAYGRDLLASPGSINIVFSK